MGWANRFEAFAAVLLLPVYFLFGCPQAWALREGAGSSTPPIRPGHFAEDACLVIGAEASKRRLPEAFFARLIWKESLFDPDALSHKGAEGIAQFMPGTADERGLSDSFDAAKAIAASAGYLADLNAQFGSLGLAAAAYNAGPSRIENWLSGAGTLPLETQEYVHFITGYTAEEWVEKKEKLTPIFISDDLPFSVACPKLASRDLRAKLPDTAFELSEDLEPSPPLGRKVPAAIAPAKKKAAKKAKLPPWGVQIAANFSQKIALAQFSRTKAKFPSILKGSAISVTSKNRSRGRRALHTVRLGAASRVAADTICNRLRSAGGACLVVKN